MPTEFETAGRHALDPDALSMQPGKLTKLSEEVPYPRLEIVAGPEEGRVFPLKTGENLIGRSQKEEGISLTDTSVSRLHARLIVSDRDLAIEDMESRNGTVVNRTKLKAKETRTLAHADRLTVGIYHFILALKPLTSEDLVSRSTSIMKKFQDAEKSGKEEEITVQEKVSSAKDQHLDSRQDQQAASSEPLESEQKKEGQDEGDVLSMRPSGQVPVTIPQNFKHAEEEVGIRLRSLFIIISILSGILGMIYLFYFRTHSVKEALPPSQPSQPMAEQEQENPPAPLEPYLTTPSAKEEPSPTQKETFPETKAPPSQEQKTPFSQQASPPSPMTVLLPPPVSPSMDQHSYHAFLDVRSEPPLARIFFEDKLVGTTPLKSPVDLVPGRSYTLVAEFDLRDVRDQYQQKLAFTADPKNEVISLTFNADLGTIKIIKLPPTVNFYMEGFYAYDKYKANPVRLDDIIYGKPIYIPFGHYVIELREKERLSSSQTTVSEIRYRREFDIDADHRLITLSVTDRDLQFFPARIQSDPSAAEVFVDGQKIGTTPFEGDLPLGHHQLKLVREGYFDYEVPLDMRTNTPFEAKYMLRTSEVGAFINKAKADRVAGQYRSALNNLVEGLKLGGSEREKAEIHFLLGDSYLMLGNLSEALSYFEQSKTHQDFYYLSLLGLAKTYFKQGENQKSLSSVAEVLLNLPDDNTIKKEGRILFKQLSPLKSVMYVATDPAGASVYVNGQEASQQTPILISELALGSYRIEVQKQGFQSEQVRQNLKLGDFAPIFIKLKPDKF